MSLQNSLKRIQTELNDFKNDPPLNITKSLLMIVICFTGRQLLWDHMILHMKEGLIV